ncbi:hypothetical protein RB623_29160 [Mesorhizobium sp. LHD-90]|uniref:hypothetical protein n=1 Tax=Mesorhizobium sp. LHD-90 TaxID=3071414 RepID=UPI0027E127B9|nr:hypothetical protein [Mesorhizobium sp. LHD-90]MDQ6438142.1 hypothetical protein [Mesorhizobium sp. LHD-90]
MIANDPELAKIFFRRGALVLALEADLLAYIRALPDRSPAFGPHGKKRHGPKRPTPPTEAASAASPAKRKPGRPRKPRPLPEESLASL